VVDGSTPVLTRSAALEAIRRGWTRKCPHCGAGPIFIKWNTPYRHCPVCGYLYERDYGDVWWVWIITDRIPLAIGIIFVYFGFRVTSWYVGLIFFGSLVLPLILTIPNRFGLAIALAYLSRRRWPDSNDPMPPVPQ
jgi:uncharacterized protein (DUF983 family)